MVKRYIILDDSVQQQTTYKDLVSKSFLESFKGRSVILEDRWLTADKLSLLKDASYVTLGLDVYSKKDCASQLGMTSATRATYHN